MRQLRFFTRFFLLFIATTLPLACGSDDNSGGETFTDTEATYTVEPAKAVGDYTSGESLATVSDADGAIVKATLKSGSTLPSGTALNSTTGEITVSDPSALSAGSYSFNVISEDAKGGTTDNSISVVINENADTDVEAEYSVSEAKSVGDYVADDILATVSDADGDIVSATLESSSELPAGTELNAISGEITVSDPSILVPGTYDFSITTEDANGGTTLHSIAITFNEDPDVDAEYTVAEAKAVEDYVMNESIATVADANGDITSAVLDSGSTLPDGVALNATSGELTVADPTLLTPGSYTLEITTEDENGGTTLHSVTLAFNENPVVVNINSGGDELVFTDITYAADAFFVGTSMPFTPDPTPEIQNTDKDDLYVTERFGSNFGYEFALDNGTYKVTLHFVELYWGAPGLGSAGGVGDRIFDVSLESVVVMDDYDIFAEVGALFATEKEFNVTLTDGMLNIDLTSSVDNAKLAAIQIEKVN